MPGLLGGGSDLERRQKQWDDRSKQIFDEQDDCFKRAGAEKESQFNNKIGATATERLKKVYNGAIPSLVSLGEGALGALIRALSGRGGALRGFVHGVGVGTVWRVWKNSLPLFVEWAKIDKQWLKARIDCTSETSAKIAAQGRRPE